MITFEFNGRSYSGKYWSPQDGKIGLLISLDTETEMINGPSTPGYVIGQAYAGGDKVYFIKLDDLPQFLNAHDDAIFIMHNAPFDISVIESETEFDFDAHIRQQRLFDTGILYRLWKLGTDGEPPAKWSLQAVAKEILGFDLNKSADTRCNFGRFRRGKIVDYNSMSLPELTYAATDSVVTHQLYEILKNKVDALGTGRLCLSHKIQLMGAYALEKTHRRGIALDMNERRQVLLEFDRRTQTAKQVLEKYGYVPGKQGVLQDYQNIVQKLGLDLPMTETGRVSAGAEYLEPYRSQHEFVDALLSFKEIEKLKSFLIKLDKGRVHPHYNVLVSTGRTSCYNPNIQQIPREGGLRECFVPASGNCFVIIDYSTLELCTLAQVCLDRFGSSRMAGLINQGVDLHCWFSAMVANKDQSQVTEQERQWAKACNFGFPGGLGTKRFLDYARNTFGITGMSEEDATELKEKWMNAFPEMRFYLQDSLMSRHDFSSLEWCDDPKIAAAIFKRIIGGSRTSTNGKPYAQGTIRWAFEEVLPDVAPWIGEVSEGSRQLLAEVSKETVTTRTGRMRAKVEYCQAKNTPFQGLAADGAKVALYRLIKAGFNVAIFVHDEFVIEIPADSDLEAKAKSIEEIVIGGMKSVVPDVQIRAEWSVADRWYKKSKRVRDDAGKIGIYSAAKDILPTGMEQRS